MDTDGYVDRWDGVDYFAVDERRLSSVFLMAGATPFGSRSGRRPGGGGLQTSIIGSPSAATPVLRTTPGPGVIFDLDYEDAASYPFFLPNAKDIVSGDRPGTGQSRIDLIVARVYDPSPEVGVGTEPKMMVERVPGNPASSPTPPDLPPLSMLISTVTVPAGTGAITVVNSTEKAVSAGGILPVATTEEMRKLKTDDIAYEGMYVDVASNNVLYRFDGDEWISAGLIPTGRAFAGPYNRGEIYATSSENNLAGTWSLNEAARQGSTKVNIMGEITAYAGSVGGGGVQDASHYLQARADGGAWATIDTRHASNVGVYYLPLGAHLNGWFTLKQTSTLEVRLVTNVAGGGISVGVGEVNFSATFF